MAIFFKIIRNGNDFSCTADGGPQFFVGRRVPYEGNIGLYNIFAGSKLTKLNYKASDFNAVHGFWATLIEPTAICEGRNFLTLNTYDRAAFTFGFGQFAAHVADGDFVSYFRALLGLPKAADYFPNLGLINGRICKTDGAAPVPLENEDSTQPLMNYLNPNLDEVQDSEVISSAKLIHWTTAQEDARVAQITQMVSVFKSHLVAADKSVGIDKLSGDKCCVIADILHHGRGGKMKWPLINEALKSSSPFESLIAIGAPKWAERKSSLKKAIKDRPDLAAKKWDSTRKDFV